MATSSVWLIPLKLLDEDARAIQLAEVAGLRILPEQQDFVGDPLRMMLVALDEGSRFP